MAETASMIMGTFTFVDTIVDWFRSFALSKAFDEDYAECLIRLDFLCWQVDQWYRQHQPDTIPSEAYVHLGAIHTAFTNARKKSDAYMKENPQVAASDAGGHGLESQRLGVQALHHSIVSRIKGGLKAASVAVPWILYEADQFKSILDTATEHIQCLQQKFPGKSAPPVPSVNELRQEIEADQNGADLVLFDSLFSEESAADRFYLDTPEGQNNTIGREYEHGSEFKGPPLSFEIRRSKEIGTLFGTKHKGPGL